MPVGCYAPSKNMSIVKLNVPRKLSVFALKKSDTFNKCELLQLTEIITSNCNSNKIVANNVLVIIFLGHLPKII